MSENETTRCSIRPVGHKILVEPKEVEKISKGGIHLVYESERMVQVSEQYGTVIAVGDTAWNAHRTMSEDGSEHPGEPWAKVGDHVWFSKFGGAFITDPTTGVDYVLMNDDDISAVFEVEKDE